MTDVMARPPQDGVDGLLLDAKLATPDPISGFVSRREVISDARRSDYRVVDVIAPAGYGKTTLLAEWASEEDRPLAWVSLDAADDDPSIILGLVATAFGRAIPAQADLAAEVHGIGVSALGRAAPRLAATLRSSTEPFVLMLDDLHTLQSPACHDVLEVVLSGVPEGSQIVLASRTEQPHVARLRATGTLREIRGDDLTIDVAGTEQIFANARVSLSRAAAQEIANRTEGWPVGIALAAMIQRDGPASGSSVSGSDPYVADYLYAEALKNLPDDLRDFLQRTSVLDQMSAELCDSVLDISDSQRHLRALEQAGMFLVPLDRRREWYRYHNLFREFLANLLHADKPGAARTLNQRAADWYLQQGTPERAVEHLLLSGDQARSADLVTQLILPVFQAGEIATVQRWLATLGDAVVAQHPHLEILAGWIAAYSGATADTQRLSASVRSARANGPAMDGSASFESARAMLLAMLCEDGPQQMLANSTIAVLAEPAWSPWRSAALALHGEAHYLNSAMSQSRAIFEEASAASLAGHINTSAHVHCESALSLLAIADGRWDDAATHVDNAMGTIEKYRVHDYATSALAFAARARLAARAGDANATAVALSHGMRARASCTFVLPFLAVSVRVHLGLAHLLAGDSSTAHHLLREIDDVIHRRPDLGVVIDEVAAFRKLLSNDRPSGALTPAPLSPAELRLLPYLQTHLSLKEIGERLFVSRNTASTQVGSIYRKLGVSTRSDAVARATSMGLLGA